MSNLLVQTIKHTNNTTEMSVDSSGRVQRTTVPCWHVYYKTGSGGDGLTGVIAWNTAYANVGTICNLSSGIVTAPITGLYHIYAQFLGTNDSGGGMSADLTAEIDISTDSGSNFNPKSKTFCDITTQGSAGYETTSVHLTISLTANDQVRTNVSSGHTYVENIDSPYSYFGGYFIG